MTEDSLSTDCFIININITPTWSTFLWKWCCWDSLSLGTVMCAHFSLVLSQGTTKNSLVLPFFFFFLYSPDKYLYTWIRSGLSLFFIRLKAPALSLSLYDGCSSPVLIFLFLCGIHSGKPSDYLCTGEPSTRHITPDDSPLQSRGEELPPLAFR